MDGDMFYSRPCIAKDFLRADQLLLGHWRVKPLPLVNPHLNFFLAKTSSRY
jgi:hypothetical protein